MAKRVNNKQTNNINNTYVDGNLKGVVTIKTYKYCIKCGKDFSEPSSDAFCDFSCRQAYFGELAQEENACYREFIGRD